MVLLRKWLSYVCLTLFLLLLLMMSLAPPVVRGQVESWLKAQGLDAEFQHLSVSLGQGRIELAGLSGRDAQGNGFGLQRLVLDLALTPLLNQQLVVESLEVTGLYLDVNRLPNDTLVGGLSLASLLGSPTQLPLEDPDSEPEAALDWSLTLERLGVTDIELCVARESASRKQLAKHCLAVEEIELSGGLQVPSLQNTSLQLPHELIISGLKVADTEGQLKVLAIDTLGVEGVQFELGKLQLQRFSLQGLTLLEREGAAHDQFDFHAALGDLQVQQVIWQPQALEVASLNLDDLVVLLHRNQAGQPALTWWMDRLAAQHGPSNTEAGPVAVVSGTMVSETMAPEAVLQNTVASVTEVSVPAVPTALEQAAAEPTTVYLQRFTLGGESSITVWDEAVQPQLQQSLSGLHLELINVDSRDVQQAAELELAGRLGEFGALTLNGEIWPFRETLNVSLAGNIEALDLLPFSAYIEQAIGYQVRTGQLHQQLSLHIKEDMLDARAELEFDKFYLQTLDAAHNDGSLAAPKGSVSGAAKNVETSLLPIGVALNLLRDSDDKIQLVLPVSGHVDEPSLSVNNVLGVVMRKAMTAAVMNYYAPFGLIDLATTLAKSATALKFEPFGFTPGSVEVSGSQASRLAIFSQLLAEKPQLSLSLCGSASGNDALNLLQLPQVPETGLILTAAQHQQLQTLVAQRLKGIKSTLLQQGVSARQVVLCQPVLALDRFADAEVEVNL